MLHQRLHKISSIAAVYSNAAGGGGGPTTFNPSDKSSTVTLSGGNLTATYATSYGGVRSISSYTSGKKYMEWFVNVGVNAFDSAFGVANATADLTAVTTTGEAGYFEGDTTIFGNNGTVLTGLSTYSQLITMGMAVDFGNLKIWFRNNGGNWNNNPSGDPVANVGGGDISFITGPIFAWALGNGANLASLTANFGSTAYSFTPPTGYTNW